jgi:hypothetical protein
VPTLVASVINNRPTPSTVRNEIDIEFETDPYIGDFLLGLRIRARSAVGGSNVWPQFQISTPQHSRRADIQIYSLSIDGVAPGCEGVTIQSIDGRLVSNTSGRLIEYPMLFLGRPPVRDDAKGLGEVLVFQDRSTTLRVYPQPLVLNEENRYTAQAVVESNGHWALYDYDNVKLRGFLESGLPLTAGKGNDALTLARRPTFLTYGLYDSVLLFSTDTTDEPYVVPVILDYAKPLTVSAPPQVTEPQSRKVEITLTDFDREIELHIFRDREWRVIGFPEEFDLARIAPVGENAFEGYTADK